MANDREENVSGEMPDVEFEWDEEKNEVNILKHKIDFEDAIKIFSNGVLEYDSPRDNEQRTVAIGLLEGRHIAVVYTLRGNVYRIISARVARRKERREYEQNYS